MLFNRAPAAWTQLCAKVDNATKNNSEEKKQLDDKIAKLKLEVPITSEELTEELKEKNVILAKQAEEWRALQARIDKERRMVCKGTRSCE